MRRLVNLLFENPQTSELIQIRKYRELASLRSKAIAFHFQLVGEQMGKNGSDQFQHGHQKKLRG